MGKKTIRKEDIIELDSGEVSLLLEAVKKQIKKVEEERFYRHEHPDAFYDIYLERYWNLVKKLDRRIPHAIFIKMPKF